MASLLADLALKSHRKDYRFLPFATKTFKAIETCIITMILFIYTHTYLKACVKRYARICKSGKEKERRKKLKDKELWLLFFYFIFVCILNIERWWVGIYN